MLTINLNLDNRDKLARRARETGLSDAELAANWISERLHRVSMERRIQDFASLSESERADLQRWAGDEATNAQLLALDAEDGGYDWGPDGPPVEQK